MGRPSDRNQKSVLRRRWFSRSLAVLLLSSALTSTSALARGVDLPVNCRTIENFAVGANTKTFGKLEFLGGITFSSSDKLLGAMSAIRFRPDGEGFVSVLDTGHWMTGRVVRDDAGHLSCLEGLRATSMLNAEGEDENVKYQMDAEGLAIGAGELLVSYEQFHRVDAYPDPGFADARPLRSLLIPFPLSELRGNRGLETLAIAPAGSRLGPVPVVVAERSIDGNGDLYAAILDGPMKGEFRVKRNDPWDVTDGAFLPDGDLLLLERRFRLSDGVGMRIRRISGAEIAPGAVVDGETLIDVDLSHQIDNMEGLDVVTGADGVARIVVVSDDNHSILQRNLMLEFRIVE